MFNLESGLQAAARLLLGRRDRPTAISSAQNDDMAAGAIMAAHYLGIDVPRDLPVAGPDDSAIAQIARPRLDHDPPAGVRYGPRRDRDARLDAREETAMEDPIRASGRADPPPGHRPGAGQPGHIGRPVRNADPDTGRWKG